MILGHERQLEYFERLIKKEKLGHAYLFYGPEAVGKRTVAQEIIKKLPCSRPIILDLENTLVSKKDSRKEIPIEDIWELKRLFSLTAPEGEWRIALINDAEKLSDEAANAFLKLLEEPGKNTLFFLITSSSDLLPATIVSRTELVRFSLVSQKLMQEYLQAKVGAAKLREEILALSFGKPGIMLKLLEEPKALEEERRFLRAFQRAVQGGVGELFNFTEEVAFHETKKEKTAEYFLRTLHKNLVSQPSAKTAEQIKKAYKIALALDTTNVNPRLALEVMMLGALQDGR